MKKSKTPKKSKIVVHCRDFPVGLGWRPRSPYMHTTRRRRMRERKHERENRSNEKYCTSKQVNASNLSNEEIQV